MDYKIGYINSQSWQAWRNSLNVLWDNTEIFYLASLIVSIIMVSVTWLYTKKKQSCNSLQELYESETEVNKSDHPSVNINPSIKLAKTIEQHMTEEDKELEKEAQSEQLAAIFRLMQEQEEKFGHTSMDELKEQMKFYCG